MQLRQIAERNNLSKGYLEQLVVALKNAQLLRSLSGRKGGYALARRPGDISLLEIFEAVIGPINLVDCVLQPDVCMGIECCECRILWLLLNYRVTDLLSQYSLEDLSDPGTQEVMKSEIKTYELKARRAIAR